MPPPTQHKATVRGARFASSVVQDAVPERPHSVGRRAHVRLHAEQEGSSGQQDGSSGKSGQGGTVFGDDSEVTLGPDDEGVALLNALATSTKPVQESESGAHCPLHSGTGVHGKGQNASARV